MSPNSLLMFLEWMSVGISLPTLKTYALTMKVMFPELITPIFAQWIQGLTKMGANIPGNQATPMSMEDLQSLVRTLQEDLAWPLWITWKTASRWGDVRDLTADNFELMSESLLVVNFREKTKTSKSQPFRHDMFAVIEDPLVPRVHAWITKRGQNPLSLLTSQQVTTVLRSHLGKPYSAHSLKRGALNFLARLASQGIVDPSLIPVLAKHQQPNPVLPPTTVRYLTDRGAIAKIGGTQALTKWL